MHILMKMIECELSEPYTIYTYRYFVQQWPELTIMALKDNKIIGVIIGKLEKHKNTQKNRGYIGMIVVEKEFRLQKVGKKLVELFIEKIKDMKGDEIVLETEVCNAVALNFYKKYGFAKVKRLVNYYLNGNDAFRLKLWLTPDPPESELEQVSQE